MEGILFQDLLGSDLLCTRKSAFFASWEKELTFSFSGLSFPTCDRMHISAGNWFYEFWTPRNFELELFGVVRLCCIGPWVIYCGLNLCARIGPLLFWKQDISFPFLKAVLSATDFLSRIRVKWMVESTASIFFI